MDKYSNIFPNKLCLFVKDKEKDSEVRHTAYFLEDQNIENIFRIR